MYSLYLCECPKNSFEKKKNINKIYMIINSTFCLESLMHCTTCYKILVLIITFNINNYNNSKYD